MQNQQNQQNQQKSYKPKESFFEYTFEILSDIFLGVVLGVAVNTITDIIANTLHLPDYLKIILQFLFIVIVLYTMKIDSKYLYSTWKGQTNYGIVFTTVFFAVQKNMLEFFSAVYVEIKNNEY